MAIRIFKRYEKKYLVTSEKAEEFISRISPFMTADEYCECNRRYTIYTVYYDDEQNTIIKHSIEKPYYKEKLRLRSYKPIENDDDTVYLEMKKKIGGIVSKRRAQMTLKEARALIEKGEKPCFSEYEDNQVADEILFFLKNNRVVPKAYIIYDRIAYFGKENKDLRITIDFDIRSRKCAFGQKNAYEGYLTTEKNSIMEIKMTDSMPMWLANILSELDIRRVRFSKYGKYYQLTKEGKGKE